MRISAVMLRTALLGGVPLAVPMIAATAAQAQDRLRAFDIPAQGAAGALNEWARQAGARAHLPV